MAVNSSSPASMEESRSFEGVLSKFTNVVKGWQLRYFVLDPDLGRLVYFLPEDRDRVSSPRGTQHVSGAIVIPSDEDSLTFHINFASGDIFRLRASTVKDRQVWVDRIRAVAHRKNGVDERMGDTVASDSPMSSVPATPTASRVHMPERNEYNLSITANDAIGSVQDMLSQVDAKNATLLAAIEALPVAAKSQDPCCIDFDMLELKATTKAAHLAMETALVLLQDYTDLGASSLMTPPVGRLPKFGLMSPLGTSPRKSLPVAAPPTSFSSLMASGGNTMSQLFAPAPNRISKSLSLSKVASSSASLRRAISNSTSDS